MPEIKSQPRGFVDRMFAAHPRALGVGYFTHMRGAVAIGGSLIGAGAACLVHALIPGIFVDRASRTVIRLHDHVVRRQSGDGVPDRENWLDYEI
jgi:hypothetical protein